MGVASLKHFEGTTFAVRQQSAKTSKILRLENKALYGIHFFPPLSLSLALRVEMEEWFELGGRGARAGAAWAVGRRPCLVTQLGPPMPMHYLMAQLGPPIPLLFFYSEK